MRDGEFDVKVQPDGSLLITATQAGRDSLAKRQQEPGLYGSDPAWILTDALQDTLDELERAEPGGVAGGRLGVLAAFEVDPSPYGQRPYGRKVQAGAVIAAGMRFAHEPNPAKWSLIDDMEADRLWWFPQQLEQVNPIDELRTKGSVVFAPVPAPQPQPKASASFGF